MSRPQHNYGSTSEVAIVGGNSQEFNSLCDNVVTNIYTINSSWRTLDNALKSLGTKKDNQGLRNKIHVTQLSANQIASATTKDIAILKSLVLKGNKQQQLQVEKLEEDFKHAVGRYSTIQKEVATKQKQHLLVSVSIEKEDTQNATEEQIQEQIQREQQFEQEMLLERETRIRQIESDVLDVNQIMRELGSVVNQQGEYIDTIENNIDHTVGNVEEGTEQLLKASRYQNRFRFKLLYLILIGAIIVVIILIFIFVHSK